jgi:hypothetical protein
MKTRAKPCRVFALLVDSKPILMFEATSLSEAAQLRSEKWLHEELSQLRSNGAPLWDGKAKMAVRQADPSEKQIYIAASGEATAPDGDLVLAYLAELDDH